MYSPFLAKNKTLIPWTWVLAVYVYLEEVVTLLIKVIIIEVPIELETCINVLLAAFPWAYKFLCNEFKLKWLMAS